MAVPAGVDPSASIFLSIQPDAVAVYVPRGEGAGGAGIPMLKAQQVPPPSCITSL